MHQKILEQACRDIVMKNMEYDGSQVIYLLYDTESPLAEILSDAHIAILNELKSWNLHIVTRKFHNPPQPLYRGGMVNPENPHAKEQNRIITSHNIEENKRIGLNHHEILQVKTTLDAWLESKKQEQILPSSEWQNQQEFADPQIESIKNELISLPKWSIVILVQSTNFRLSTFRIRLELFHRGIHVVEHNHLAYIPEQEFDTFIDALQYRTDEYVRFEKEFSDLTQSAQTTQIESIDGSILTFWPLESIRGNTGDYTWVENKGWTFPIGEVFTEAIDLESVHGNCLVESFPNEDFSVNICEPFELIIEKGRVLPSPHFPSAFQKLYDWVIEYEWEVMVRELGFGLNPAISTATPLTDINFHERKVGVHLSLGKKHGIYGKKLPKAEVQRFHIDVFVALKSVSLGQTEIFRDGKWTL